LYDAFGQRQVATLFTALDQYHVILELDPRWQVSEESLTHLYARSSLTDELVPLSVLGRLEPDLAPIPINHQELCPAVPLSSTLAPVDAVGGAVAAIPPAARRAGRPGSVGAASPGAAQACQDSLRGQPWLILAAVVTVYIVPGVLYESPLLPLSI